VPDFFSLSNASVVLITSMTSFRLGA
jgi:triosephosphate isomerase